MDAALLAVFQGDGAVPHGGSSTDAPRRRRKKKRDKNDHHEVRVDVTRSGGKGHRGGSHEPSLRPGSEEPHAEPSAASPGRTATTPRGGRLKPAHGASPTSTPRRVHGRRHHGPEDGRPLSPGPDHRSLSPMQRAPHARASPRRDRPSPGRGDSPHHRVGRFSNSPRGHGRASAPASSAGYRLRRSTLLAHQRFGQSVAYMHRRNELQKDGSQSAEKKAAAEARRSQAYTEWRHSISYGARRQTLAT